MEPIKLADQDAVHVYGNELGCDVAFLVGQDEPSRWRLPAHTLVLRRNNLVFRAMFSETWDSPGPREPVHVKDVDGRAFDNLLRCLYQEPVTLTTTETALLTLYAGHKYQCPHLVSRCTSYLADNLRQANVLAVLKDARMYIGDYKQNSPANLTEEHEPGANTRPEPESIMPSAPLLTLPGSEPDLLSSLNLDKIESSLAELLEKCLSYVDLNANSILDMDEFEDLDPLSVPLILSRDTLDVKEELKVFQVLHRWADKECKRKHLPLNVESKRAVLAESLFLPRYLTMTLSGFQIGPGSSGLFADTEVSILEGILSGQLDFKAVGVTTPALRQRLEISRTPRRPVPPPSAPPVPPPPKRKRLSSIFFLRGFRLSNCKCCKSKTLYSPDSSPASSNQSSPTRVRGAGRRASAPPQLLPPPRRESQTPRINVVEQVVLCFACIFD